VEGRPFDAPVQRRAGGGWTWLVDGDRLDEHAVVAVVDVAPHVVTHPHATGKLAAARMAAETAAMAAPFEEIPRLDLAAVATAEGRHAEVRRIVRDEIANRTDDEGAPPDLAARTEEILQRRADRLGSRAS
ncbi:MAG: peptidoglycan-binding protein LysM, partial [Phycicoccus sp.]|nr:peptidoglycan-binding protein LysM [Phycicoccus sp.]